MVRAFSTLLRLRHRALPVVLLGLVVGTAAPAQQPSQNGAIPPFPQGEGYDFDTLAACSVIYGRVAALYLSDGRTAENSSFQNTAYAYSASALVTLSQRTRDPAQAYRYAQERMTEVADSLNRSAERNSNGETGVIEEWLPYCDSLGDGVSQLLVIRERLGW